jgi:ATP-dependent Clp protease ATP-binding subunit ClpA
MTTFKKYLQTILDQGAREAAKEGSATVEAQYLLLAIAADQERTTHQLLASVGLDYAAIRAALDREFEQSLSAAGVSRAAFDLPQPSNAPERSPQPGASVKLVLERGLASTVHKGDLQPACLLLGIVQARLGTVPRTLELAGVDRADLVARIQQTLANEDE